MMLVQKPHDQLGSAIVPVLQGAEPEAAYFASALLRTSGASPQRRSKSR